MAVPLIAARRPPVARVQRWSTDRTDSVETVTRRLLPFVPGRTIAPKFFRAAGDLMTFGVQAAIRQGRPDVAGAA
jgi:hypothetical protein